MSKAVDVVVITIFSRWFPGVAKCWLRPDKCQLLAQNASSDGLDTSDCFLLFVWLFVYYFCWKGLSSEIWKGSKTTPIDRYLNVDVGDVQHFMTGVHTNEMMAKQVKPDEHIMDKVTAPLTLGWCPIRERSLTSLVMSPKRMKSLAITWRPWRNTTTETSAGPRIWTWTGTSSSLSSCRYISWGYHTRIHVLFLMMNVNDFLHTFYYITESCMIFTASGVYT